MKITCQFKSLDHSQSLVEHIENKFQKLTKFEIKPIQVNVNISADKRMKRVEVHVKGLERNFDAKGEGENFQIAVDKCLTKLIRQLGKEKQKIKKHKNYDRSASGKLRALNAQLEVTDYNKVG